MAKTAFAVEDGLVPGHTTSSLGHSTAKFNDAHLGGDINVDGGITAGGTITTSGSVFAGGEELSGGGGGGGGGIDAATSIAYSIALG